MKKNKEKGEGKGKKGGREKKAEKKKELICWSGSDRKLSKPFLGEKCHIFPPRGKREGKRENLKGENYNPPRLRELFEVSAGCVTL